MCSQLRPTTGKGAEEVNDVERWLQLSGFVFNPFSALDAASDQYLHRYLVQIEAQKATWSLGPTLVFEPRGGGKTALRLRTVQDCYYGQGGDSPFPISYIPPFLQWRRVTPSPAEHMKAILGFGAMQLLISLIYRPHWFLEIPLHYQQFIRMYLDTDLPGPLLGYLNELNTREDLEHLWRRIDFSPFIRSKPDGTPFYQLLDKLKATTASAPIVSPFERWQTLQELLFSVLKMKAIYILLDGLDGSPETSTDPEVLLKACDYLWENGLTWAKEHIYIKAFLPNEVKETMAQRYPQWIEQAQIANIQWTEEQLISMLQKRIEAATQGELQSLDILAAPDFTSVERRIVEESAYPLPRDVLLLTSQLLICHVQRCGQYGQRIEERDLFAAKNSLDGYI